MGRNLRISELAKHAETITRETDLSTRLTMTRNFIVKVAEEIQKDNGMIMASAEINMCQTNGFHEHLEEAFAKEMEKLTQMIEDWVKDFDERKDIAKQKEGLAIPPLTEKCNPYIVLAAIMRRKSISDEKIKNRLTFERCYPLAAGVEKYVKLEYFVPAATREAMRKCYISAEMESKPREDLVGNAKETKRKLDGCENYRIVMVIDLFSLLTLYAAASNERDFLEVQLELLGKPQTEEKQKAEENGRKYSEDLLKLFHYHVEELDSLVGLSDSEIAARIRQLATERDKFGKPLIENPENHGNKSDYAKALKDNRLIKCRVGTFRRLL